MSVYCFKVKIFLIICLVLTLEYSSNLFGQNLEENKKNNSFLRFLQTQNVETNNLVVEYNYIQDYKTLKTDTISTSVDTNSIDKLEDYPDEDAWIPVEKQPDIDMMHLQNCIVYPDSARREGIEGQVMINVLVGKNGEVLKTRIIKSDNEIFNVAVTKAIVECGKFTPAINKGKPILCWTIVPMNFKLKKQDKR